LFYQRADLMPQHICTYKKFRLTVSFFIRFEKVKIDSP
jgi:hypothetical protein